jgi:hypothetical protein
MPSGTYEDPSKKHLFAVCTNVCPAGKHLIVSITGWTNNLCDGTTRLGVGDHPFLYKDSYVFYRKARVEDAAVLSAGVDGGQFIPHAKIDPAVLAKILAGICKSIHTPKKVKKYANCP